MKGIQSLGLLEKFPDVDRVYVHQLYAREVAKIPKLVVLDDDPTGIQTVHDVSVFTHWEESDIREGFAQESRLFFILTNSRSFSSLQTEEVHHQIAQNVCHVAKETGKPFIIVSRSDSTLRGHYPLETETLRRTIEESEGIAVDAEILVPFFPEGGRYTVDDNQYVRQGQDLFPVGQTEFAKDKSFGFHESDLKRWCEEKTKGRVKASEVTSIGLRELRSLDFDAIEHKLTGVKHFGKVVVNAVDYVDLEVFAIAFARALSKGYHCILRSAASIVKVLGNVASRPYLQRNELVDAGNMHGGLVIVGSHIQKTTMQLMRLFEVPGILPIQFDQHTVLVEGGLDQEVDRVSQATEEAIGKGVSVVVYTRRERVDFPSDDPAANLLLSVSIANALTSVVGRLRLRPSFLVAKGGITSCDVGVQALRVRKARVLGQIAAGVPVWRTGQESKFPGLPYVIFPGNVGDEDSLARIVASLMGNALSVCPS